MKNKIAIFIFTLLLPLFSSATLYLELTQGIDSALPIAVVPFGGQSTNSSLTDIAGVIQQDLQNSGRFNPLDVSTMVQFPHTAKEVQADYWKSLKVNNVVVGSIKPLTGGRFEVNFALTDFSGKNILASQKFTTTANGFRALAHHIADMVYEKLLSQRGIFSTKIVYVVVKNLNSYALEVADYDGENAKTILQSGQPIMSPAWSPDGKDIAYVSFEKGSPAIYIHNLATGQRKIVANYPGINGAPSFSPDGKKLALVLTLSGSPNIYIKDLATDKLQQVMKSNSIDTEPVWSRDGQSLLFTSDRGGAPQIYQVNLASGSVKRLTFDGKYNARASFTADGQNIVVLHRTDAGVFSIAIQDLASGRLRVLAQPPYSQSPSVAPNGAMVVYSWRDDNEVFLLGMVSSDGKVQLKLPSRQGSVREPAWSPFLQP